MERHVAEADARFRSYTVDDTAGRLAKVAHVGPASRGWWWRRVPDSGPIAEFPTMY
jgi:hypothetical protein